ncbi:hypothetical protein C8J27_103208 [Rhodobacter aestuarii]|uniref:DUF305 domain-containing protein n=1 Tax=Rhodobacter aestuarii TaxID=453582 RepID=A0A1N7K369_9RHOB|nr:DUF305 domain-containing protein [Rhodobacter aestuarii]PTV95878.1 hypothetical protein C8J27_103208 [Rhodobacter aestuarii]SIS55997.1 protein of unknown function [Rhodobacter aestuarii]
MSPRTRRHIALLSPLAFALAFGAYADDLPAPMMRSAATATADAAPSTAAFEAAKARMATDMAAPYTGNADLDFVRSLLPQKQAAVDMAQIVVENGADPDLRHRAEAMAAQDQAEIEWLMGWLEKHGQP